MGRARLGDCEERGFAGEKGERKGGVGEDENSRRAGGRVKKRRVGWSEEKSVTEG